MKKLLLALTMVLFAFPACAQSRLYSNSTTGMVGIGMTAPAEKLDVPGTVTAPAEKLDVPGTAKAAGTGSEACSSSAVGQIRYNATGQYMEICSYP